MARGMDKLLPEHHQQKWIKWFQELNDLELVKINPKVFERSCGEAIVELSIHTFTDCISAKFLVIFSVFILYG